MTVIVGVVVAHLHTAEMQNLIDRLNETRTANERCKSAHLIARQRAVESEIARSEAEFRHANTLADALMNGQELPKKPSQLSSLQTSDDLADSALAIIERRAELAAGAQAGAAAELVEASLSALANDRHAASREAMVTMIAPFKILIAALGRPAAVNVVTELMNMAWTDDSMTAVTAIADLAPEVQNPRGMWEVRSAEMRVTPTTAEIAALCESHLNEDV